MAVYAISFRVDYDSDYDRRYEALTDVIRAQASGTQYWEETTSFFLLTSDLGPGALADAIVAAAKFDVSKDILVVIYLSGAQGHAVRGAYTDKDILTLLKSR